MGDIFDQVAAAPAATGDIFDQVAASPVESPIPPPQIKLPQQAMSQSALAPIDSSDPSIPKLGGLHAGSYDIAPRVNGQIASSNSPEMAQAALGGALGVGGALLGPKILGPAVKAVPYIAASEAINLARQHLPLGKYIPPGAEMLPFFMSGGKAPAAAEGKAAAIEGEAIAAPRFDAEGQPIPIGKLPIAKGNPYAGPRTPQSMEPAQSTTIGLHGYHPESQTMLVQFKNGRVYSYSGVPPEIYQQYRNSESQGSFFANNIKGRYQTDFRGTVKPTAGAQVRQALGR